MLISSGNNLTDTSGNTVVPALCVTLSPVRLTRKTNHHRVAACTYGKEQSSNHSLPKWKEQPGEEALRDTCEAVIIAQAAHGQQNSKCLRTQAHHGWTAWALTVLSLETLGLLINGKAAKRTCLQ